MKLGLGASDHHEHIGGLGGLATCVIIQAQIQVTRDTGSKVTFRGEYAAVTEVDALDVCVLGRDITELFAVVVDRPGNRVCLLSQRHRYTIEQE